jgi:hypothetical protein
MQVLIYRCPRGHMIYLLLSLTYWDLIGSLNKWLLICLRNKKYWSSLGQQFNNLIFLSIWIEKKIIRCVKNEGSNLNAMTIALKSIMRLQNFYLNGSFQGICFGHVFPKVCKYLEMSNLVLKFCKKQTRMEQGMFKFKYSPKKIEFSNENKVNFNFFINFLSFFFNQIVLIGYNNISNLRFSLFLIQ